MIAASLMSLREELPGLPLLRLGASRIGAPQGYGDLASFGFLVVRTPAFPLALRVAGWPTVAAPSPNHSFSSGKTGDSSYHLCPELPPMS